MSYYAVISVLVLVSLILQKDEFGINAIKIINGEEFTTYEISQ